MKSGFAVFLAGYAQPTTGKPRASAKDAKANTEWVLHVLSTTALLRKKRIAFCGFCDQNNTCGKWRKFREAGKQHDSLLSYQRLEDNIAFIQKNGMEEFKKQQETREKLLRAILTEFNEGRSKTFYCIAATVLEIGELESVLENARAKSKGLDIRVKSEVMHSLLNEIAENKKYLLKLRK